MTAPIKAKVDYSEELINNLIEPSESTNKKGSNKKKCACFRISLDSIFRLLGYVKLEETNKKNMKPSGSDKDVFDKAAEAVADAAADPLRSWGEKVIDGSTGGLNNVIKGGIAYISPTVAASTSNLVDASTEKSNETLKKIAKEQIDASTKKTGKIVAEGSKKAGASSKASITQIWNYMWASKPKEQ